MFVDFSSDLTNRLNNAVNDMKTLEIDRRQMKAMIKNQNYHFTEL